MNVFDNKTTASINTYIPDNKYTQRKKTDKKANFSGKVYFTEYIEDLTNLLKRFKLKSQFNKSSTVVCFEQIQIVNFPCKGNQRHWINEECPIEDPYRRAVFYTRTITKCVNGGNYTIDNPNNGDFFIEDALGGGGLPGGGATTPVENIDDDCEDGFTKNLEGECVQYACYDDKKEYDEITQRCECIEGFTEDPTNGSCKEKPCPGDPFENPEIAPSGGWNINGGRYGWTRFSGKKFHDGTDIKANVNSPLHSMLAGTVTDLRNSFSPGKYEEDSYGNYVEITSIVNGEEIQLRYNHLNRVDVAMNSYITQGSQIGLTGNTGNAQTKNNVVVIPHVHIRSRKKVNGNLTKTNPEDYMSSTINNDGTSTNTNCN